MDAELNRPIDFLIITVLEEELKAAISCLDDKIRYSPPDDPYTYYLGYIPIHNNLAYHVVVTRLSQFGGIEAGVATTQLIERWHPQKIILLGIAGGIESAGVTYGDVVIAEYVYYYEPGRQGKRKVARPLQFPCDDLLFFKARDFAIADEANGWFEDISPVPQTKLSARPAIHCAPIGSGEQVIANKIILDKLLIGCPKMKAVAMEGAGVAQACKRAGLGFLEIRGISDLADQQKDDGWHVYAAQAAALFCRLFLQSHPISTRNEAFKEEYRQQSGQHARPNAEQLFLSALAPQRFDPPFDEALLPEPEYFVGRETLLADLCQRLAAKHVTALRGMGGIGKTALASVAVRALRKEGRYQDGIVVLLCHERTDPVALLTDVLTRFDPAKKRPATAEHAFLVELAHTLLHGKDTLVVLDNVEPGWAIEQIIEPLRVAGATVLLTARHQLSFPAHKDTLSLDVLSDESALELFAQSLDRNSRFELSPMETKAGEKIIAALGNHTLAIKLAGKYVRDFQPPDLMTFAAELDPQAALKLPEGEQERIVEAVLGQSIHTLPKDALQLFANLAAFPTADFGRNAALALGLETQLQNPERCVNLLIYRGLLDIYTHQEMGLHSDRSRLHLHPLLFAFAQHLFQEEKREHQERAFLALAQYYARYTNRVSDQWLGPDEINILSLLEWAEKNKKEAVVIELCSGMRFFWRDYYRPEDGLRYLRWGENASAAVARASRSGIDRLRMANLARCRGEILFSMGRLAEAEAIFRDDLQIRQDEQDVEGKSLTLCRLGQVAHQRGLLDMAQDYFQRSLEIFREERNLEAEGSVLSHLGQIARRRGRLGEAERYFREALEIVKKTYNHRGEGEVLLFLGRIARRRGHLDAAAWNFQEALHIAREEHDRRGEDLALSYLGEVALQRGEIEQARQLFEESMHIAREIRDHRGEGVLLLHLGHIPLQRGQPLDAARYFEESLAITHEVQDRRGEGVAHSCLGQVAFALGQYLRAQGYFQRALEIAHEVQDRQGEGVAHSYLGQIAQAQGDFEQAEQSLTKALQIMYEVQDRRGEGIALYHLGQIHQQQGRVEEAEKHFEKSLVALRDVQDKRGEAVVYTCFGRIARDRSYLSEAQKYFEQALALDREVQDRHGESTDLNDLGQVAILRPRLNEAELRPRLDEAERLFQQALSIRREAGDRRGEGADLLGLARVAEYRGERDTAAELYRSSLAIRRALGSHPDIAESLVALGQFQMAHHEQQAARDCLQEALALYQQMQAPQEESVRALLRQLEAE